MPDPARPPFIGLLCDVARGAYLRREVVAEMLRCSAQAGFTHVLPYLENMIRLPSQARACPACAYGPDDWQEFERIAAANGIELVPHVNVVGHTEQIIPHYPELRSAADEHEMDVTLPAAQAWVGRCLEEFTAFAGGRHVLIGGDEWQAPRRLLEARVPLGPIWAAQINRAAAVLTRQGRIPIVWHDMLLHYPQAIETLSREVVIAFWFYDEEADYPALADLAAAGFRTIMASGCIGGVLSRRRQRAVRSGLAAAARHRTDGFLLTSWETNRWEMQKLAIAVCGHLLRDEAVPPAISEALSILESLQRLPRTDRLAQDWRRRLERLLEDDVWQSHPEAREYLGAEATGDVGRSRASYLRYHHPEGPLWAALSATDAPVPAAPRPSSVAIAATAFALEETTDPDLGPVLRLVNGQESLLLYPRFGGTLQGWRIGDTEIIPNPLPAFVRRQRPQPGGYRSYAGAGGLRAIWGLGYHQNPCIIWQDAYAWRSLEQSAGSIRIGMQARFHHADIALEVAIRRDQPGFSLSATAVNHLDAVHACFDFNLPLAFAVADLPGTRFSWDEGGTGRHLDLVATADSCCMLPAREGLAVVTPGYACAIRSDPAQTMGYFVDWGAGFLTPDVHGVYRRLRRGETVSTRWDLCAEVMGDAGVARASRP